jgi:gamma-glutamyltranspeptidase/glutathione hydrolase
VIRRAALVAWVAVVGISCQQRASAPPARAVPHAWRYPLDARPTVASHGMVVSDRAIASGVGAEVLATGGNAVDAAVATAFALAVVLPEAGNLGGGGFAVVRTADGTTAALDFREVAPAAAGRDMYLDAAGKPTKDSQDGPRASGVPGSVAGLWALHQRFGSRPWAVLLAPAIRLAEDGFPVDERIHDGLVEARVRLARSAASAALYLPGGQPLAVGAMLKNPDLAAVLRRVAAGGAAGFYQGATAGLIAAEMARNGGLLTEADLAAYGPKWRAPLVVAYRGHELIGLNVPSGGEVVAEIAELLEGYDLAALGWHSVQHLHLLAEAEQRAFADRNAYLGDPDFVPAHLELLAPATIAKRRATIDPDRATPSAGVAPGREPEHTTHFAVVDGTGTAVAVTTTLNELYGSGVTIAGAGFLMNDEMDDFAVKPGSPNLFGLVQGEANRIAPGKRPLSCMTPTIVVGPDGKVRLIAGARGGSRIISATFQVISNVVDFHMDVGAAVAAPRVHHQHLPDVLYYEPDGIDVDARRALEARGWKLGTKDPIANAPTIVRVPEGWSAVADPRRGGAAQGY